MFKIGDKVRIIGNGSSGDETVHMFPIGTVGIIIDKGIRPDSFRVKHMTENYDQYVSSKHLIGVFSDYLKQAELCL